MTDKTKGRKKVLIQNMSNRVAWVELAQFQGKADVVG